MTQKQTKKNVTRSVRLQTKKNIGGVRLGTKGNISKGVRLQTKKYIGGLRLGIKAGDTEYTIKEAFNFFLDNIREAKILTDSSVASITLVLTINDDGEKFPYPYYSTRPDTFDQPLKKILLKVLVSAVEKGTRTYNISNGKYAFRTPYRTRIECEISSDNTVMNEVSIQREIYSSSFFDEQNKFDPICPAILGVSLSIDRETTNTLYAKIVNKLQPRLITEGDKDENILKLFFKNTISIICMEYLQDYIPLDDVNYDVKYEYFTLYELLKIYEYGFIHCDLHGYNIMVNTNYGYTYHYEYGEFIKNGKIKIIDFGRSRRFTPNEDETFRGSNLRDKILFVLSKDRSTFLFKHILLLLDYDNGIDHIEREIQTLINEQKINSKSFISNMGEEKLQKLIDNFNKIDFTEDISQREASQGAPEIASQGAPEIASQGAPQGAPEIAPQGASQGAPEIASQGAPQGAPEIAPEIASQGAPQGAPEIAPQGAPEIAPQGASQGAPEIAPQQSLVSRVGTIISQIPYTSNQRIIQTDEISENTQPRPRVNSFKVALDTGGKKHMSLRKRRNGKRHRKKYIRNKTQ